MSEVGRVGSRPETPNFPGRLGFLAGLPTRPFLVFLQSKSHAWIA